MAAAFLKTQGAHMLNCIQTQRKAHYSIFSVVCHLLLFLGINQKIQSQHAPGDFKSAQDNRFK